MSLWSIPAHKSVACGTWSLFFGCEASSRTSVGTTTDQLLWPTPCYLAIEETRSSGVGHRSKSRFLVNKSRLRSRYYLRPIFCTPFLAPPGQGNHRAASSIAPLAMQELGSSSEIARCRCGKRIWFVVHETSVYEAN